MNGQAYPPCCGRCGGDARACLCQRLTDIGAQALPLIDGPEGFGSPSLIPERSDSFSLAMARVEELRVTRRAELERRDRAEWEWLMHVACENSLFKRQA